MAFETTHILITKLELVASHEPNFPGLKTDVVNNRIKELKHLQEIIETANKTIDDEWDNLLKDIFSLEDDIEVLLGRTVLQSHKVWRKRRTSSSFSSDGSLSNKIEQLTKGIRSYCNKSQSSPSSDSGVPAVVSIPPAKPSTDSEELEVSTDNETISSNASTIVLMDFEKKLSQQVLSRLTLQYLLLTVNGAYLGKAILLWRVYNADDIKRHFQCRAWIPVSD